MLDGHVLVDAHVHVPVLGSLAPAWLQWARDFGPDGILEEVWDAEGVPRPDRLDALFDEQGVDHALLFCEYFPKATGYQRFEDLLPIVEHNPRRFRPVANVNPHLHFPIADEVRRQLDLGAAALKLHPVHGGFRCDDASLYPAYQVLADRGVPLVVHCGTSSFPGSANELADPAYLLPVVRDFPTSTWCWRTAAAAGGTTRPPSWRWPTRRSGSSCRGCPPSGCPTTSTATTWARLARRWIFATDWPGVPDPQNARAVAALGLCEELVGAVLGGNALQVYAGLSHLDQHRQGGSR